MHVIQLGADPGLKVLSKPDEPIDEQVERLAELLKKKVADYRLGPRVKPGEFFVSALSSNLQYQRTSERAYSNLH